ncbi:glycogen debranching protein GlgX [Pasteurellaceae bacterium HPA106]|uniref:glycogen debranching protein GlgX n=1 Tax=Spirabiliibacterium pneumoniae TaxID=221400 RepID=UPI001AADFBA4|nr:glycogen debranching protein GlgX [Spirabiliibacterium pneumoniae]MBE2896943.1 glycogen debranching protein GlgX [Spirabiliibacterium pneumoniae]
MAVIGRVKAGVSAPLGASHQVIEGVEGINFALFSEHATLVELCLFSRSGREHRFRMQCDNAHIWSVFLVGMQSAVQYGFRVHGNTDAAQGLFFNPQKVLLDPYAKAVSHKPHFDDESLLLFDFTNDLDNSSVAPKAMVVSDDFRWQDDAPPNTPWSQTVIYELHVKGFSQLNERIPQALRGTYAGLAHPVSVNYLKELGITAVELMPVAFHADELHLQQKGLSNYWGYNTLAPMAVESDYASNRAAALSEFKQLVKTLHQAGIEVILDVVFNHTADSDAKQPTLSQRGIDNKNYYWLDEQGRYHNWTGCGNVLNCSQPNVRQWVLDCLRYWVSECHVDGFRFDLATVLGREPHFNRDAALFQAIAEDPILREKKFIAEPWDIGWGGYQLGHFPPYFAQWNDRFRDDMRAFWLHYRGTMGLFAQRWSGSSDIFQARSLPFASINYICSHDGYTAHDLVTYEQKYNWANGEENRDGHNDNINNNFGVEGECDDVVIKQKRQAALQGMLATALLAHGTPMLLSGDELGHSQQGNNNAYCQDNATTWLNWAQADWALYDYVKALIALRKQIAALNQSQWLDDSQVAWFDCAGIPMSVSAWEDSQSIGFQILLNECWLLLINRTYEHQHFQLIEGQWHSVLAPLESIQNSVELPSAGIYVFTR